MSCYFSALQRVAVALNWPKDVWAILLQCKLKEKAQEPSAALLVEDSLLYNKVRTLAPWSGNGEKGKEVANAEL